MIEIRLTGTYEECRKDAEALFGVKPITVPVGVISVRPETAEKAPSDEPEAKGKETVAEAAEAAESAQEEAETAPSVTTDEAPEQTAEEAPEQSAEEAPEQPVQEAPAVTMIEARAKMNDLRQKKGAAAVRMILDQLGYKKFTDVPESDYPKLMVCCEALENSDAV